MSQSKTRFVNFTVDIAGLKGEAWEEYNGTYVLLKREEIVFPDSRFLKQHPHITSFLEEWKQQTFSGGDTEPLFAVNQKCTLSDKSLLRPAQALLFQLESAGSLAENTLVSFAGTLTLGAYYYSTRKKIKPYPFCLHLHQAVYTAIVPVDRNFWKQIVLVRVKDAYTTECSIHKKPCACCPHHPPSLPLFVTLKALPDVR